MSLKAGPTPKSMWAARIVSDVGDWGRQRQKDKRQGEDEAGWVRRRSVIWKKMG